MVNIKNLFRSIKMDVIMLLVFGGTMLFQTTPDFIISLKPAVSFEQMLDGEEVKAGSHVAGNVVYVLDSFASQTTYTKRSDGSRSGDRKSGKYYLVPISGGFIGLKSRQADVAALDSLTEETFQFIQSGTEPTTELYMEGVVSVMEPKIEKYYKEYLGELGYSEAEIESFGEPLLVQFVSLNAVRIMFAIGLVLALLAIVILVRRYKDLCRGSGLPKAEDLPNLY